MRDYEVNPLTRMFACGVDGPSHARLHVPSITSINTTDCSEAFLREGSIMAGTTQRLLRLADAGPAGMIQVQHPHRSSPHGCLPKHVNSRPLKMHGPSIARGLKRGTNSLLAGSQASVRSDLCRLQAGQRQARLSRSDARHVLSA